MTVFSNRRTLKQTSEGDIKNNELAKFEWVEGAEAVVTEIKNTIMTIQGEDPFDREHGIDIFALSEEDETFLEAEIRDAVMQMHSDDVDSINEIDAELNENRRAEVIVDLTLVDGTPAQIGTQI